MLSLAGGAIILLVAFFFFYLRSQKTGILVLDPTTNITIKVNGRVATPETTDRGLYVPLYAGQYRLELDKPGYTAFTKDIQTTPGNTLEVRPAFSLLPSIQQSTGDSIDYVRPAADESSVYYLGDFRQRLFRLNVSTQTTVPLTDLPLNGVTDVEWGGDPNVALIVQTDGTYLHEIPRFDFENQIYVKIGGPEIVSPVWDPNNPDRIASGYFPSTGEKSLVVADQRFTTITRLASIPNIPDPKVIWSPNSDYLLLLARSATYSDENLWLYTLADGSLKQITQTGGITDAKFSPDSAHVLVQQTSQLGAISREILAMNDDTTQSIGGTLPISETAWKDSATFYEPSDDLKSLVLRNLNGSSQSTPLSLPDSESVQALFYFSKPDKVIIATTKAVYTVNLEKQ